MAIAQVKPVSPPKAEEKPDSLKIAFQKAIAFQASRASSLSLPNDAIREAATEEASFNRASIDDHGLTAGMQLKILQPARDLIAEWKQAKEPFMTAIQPFMKDIDAVELLNADVAALKERRTSVKDQIEGRHQGYEIYRQRAENKQQAEERYKQMRELEGRREPNLTAYNPLYWIGLLSIGVAEWLINYDTFYLFMGVPAIAAGATLVLGVLLAFAAHGHGTVLKQWTYRFGADVHRKERLANARYFGLATFSALVVLIAAGGSRYGAALHALAGQPQINILGAQAVIDVSPLRDVLLSLLANVAAWAVGVYFAYLCHDKNPDYMDAKHHFDTVARAFTKIRQPVDEEIATEDAKIEKEIKQKEVSATNRAADVVDQRDMLRQVAAHEDALLHSIYSSIRRNVESYRNVITQIALERKGALQFHRAEQSITPHEFRVMKLALTDDVLQRLLA